MKRLIFVILVLVALSFLYDEEVYMKDFVGLQVTELEMFLIENNIKANINYIYSDEDEDIVLSQNIKEGKHIKNISDLVVEVSNGVSLKEAYVNYSVNELGRIPVMMYHGIYDLKDEETNYLGGNVDSSGYHRTVESFRNDLEFYYNNDYRMIKMVDYANGVIDVEIGKSPIILTFDDGLKNNINVLGLDDDGEIIIDPNSAVGVLEDFKNKYPDFNVTATFFLNGGLFRQPKYNEEIIEWLVDNGYDIGNHSFSHLNLSNVTSDEVVKEIGSMYKLLSNVTNDNYINVVSLPFGEPTNRENNNFEHIIKGIYNDYEYNTISTLRVGWESDLSPFHDKFDIAFIKRIRAYDNNGEDFDIEHNFRMLENNRYISSGDTSKVVIPSEFKNNVSKDFQDKLFVY